jgi:hypothetical protein
VAHLPLPADSILPGSYLLTLSGGPARVQSDSFAVTIGAVGPRGPRGEPGVAGPPGLLPSLDALGGLPCNLEGAPGTAEVTYSPSGTVLMTCGPGEPEICRSQSCVDGVLTHEAFFENGVCPAPTTSSCRGYACNSTGDSCLSRCEADDDCAAGFHCSVGRCRANPPPPSGLPRIVINEVDYDQPATDATEFVEVYNAGSVAGDLDGLALVLVNGANSEEYGRVDLAGVLDAGAFAVIGAPGLVGVPSSTLQFSFPLSEGNLQNGPDAIALFDTGTLTVLDSIAYEGPVEWNTGGPGGPFPLAEGGSSAPADTGVGSLVRLPDGQDTDDGAADWVLSLTPSPGSPQASE